MNLIKAILILMAIFTTLGCLADESEKSDFKDLNGDGVQDVFYEYEEQGYYELVDSNFDGKIDLSTFYSNDDKIVSSRQDDDFDGYLETRSEYENGSLIISWVDVNHNELANIVFYYKDGILDRAERLYFGEPLSKIEKVRFNYGYPESIIIEESEITEEEFHDSRIDR